MSGYYGEISNVMYYHCMVKVCAKTDEATCSTTTVSNNDNLVLRIRNPLYYAQNHLQITISVERRNQYLLCYYCSRPNPKTKRKYQLNWYKSN